MSQASRAEIEEILKRATWDVAQKRLESVDAKMPLRKLGVDSVAMLEIVGCFESELGIHLPDEALSEVQTVGELLDLIAREQANAHGSEV